MLVKFIVGFCVELGNDEVYYWTYALHLQGGYFDHPPLLAVFLRCTTANLWCDNPFFLRLTPILCCAASTWIIFQIGCAVRNARTGWYAALLYSFSIYFGTIGGFMVLPDGPNLLFWQASLWAAVLLVKKENLKISENRLLIYLGICSGMAVLAKVHGLFVPAGFLGYTLLFERRFFKNPAFYALFVIVVLVNIPAIKWLFDNDFATFNFHSGRVKSIDGLDFTTFSQTFLGQFAYMNPIIFIGVIWALGAYFWGKTPFIPKEQARLFFCMGIPIIAIVTGISLFRTALPHWASPGFSGLLVLTAAFLDARVQKDRAPRLIWTAGALWVTVMLLAAWAVRGWPGYLGNATGPKMGAGDLTLDMSGWTALGDSMAIHWKKYPESASSFLVADKWFPAAHLDYYVAKPLGIPFVVLGDTADIHHYAWLNRYRKPMVKGDTGYFISPSNSPRKAENMQPFFEKVELVDSVFQMRAGHTVRRFDVYKCTEKKD